MSTPQSVAHSSPDLTGQGPTSGVSREPAWRRAPSKPAHEAFGRRLKAIRERCGISVNAVADSVKINASLLVELERGDLSNWPAGIFGRGFIRAYAAAIGLDPEAVVADFRSLGAEAHAAGLAAAASPVANGLRLTLAGDGRTAMASVATRASVAAVEAGLIVLAGFLLARLMAADAWGVSGAIGLVYYPVTSACLGRSPSLWWLSRQQSRGARQAARAVQFHPRRTLQLIVGQNQPIDEQE